MTKMANRDIFVGDAVLAILEIVVDGDSVSESSFWKSLLQNTAELGWVTGYPYL
jgi:hypothetical protein